MVAGDKGPGSWIVYTRGRRPKLVYLQAATTGMWFPIAGS